MQYEVTEGEWPGRSLGDLSYGPNECALVLQRREQTYVAPAMRF